METKSLLFGISGFILGGLVVSIAATSQAPADSSKNDEMSMSQMTENLRDKRGDAYDSAFIDGMIMHHQSAVDMAELSPDRAKHDEVKQLSAEIIAAQQKEIEEMERWRSDWGYAEQHDNTRH